MVTAALSAKIFFASVPAAGSLWLLRDWPLLLGIPFAGIVYAIALVVLGVVPTGDLRGVRSLLGRVRPVGRLGAKHRASTPEH